MDFEDSMPMDLGSFYFEDPVGENRGSGGDGYGGDGYGYGYDDGLPHLPRLLVADTEDTPLPKLRIPRVEETFGGERYSVGSAVAGGDRADSNGRVEPYTGNDMEGICRAIVKVAGYAGLESPYELRPLISKAIGTGPIAPEKGPIPYECYSGDDDFSRAFAGLSISAYAGPSAMILRLPEHRLVLLACGSEIVLIDPKDQPAPVRAKKTDAGLPSLPMLTGEGALVMRCRNHLEVSEFISTHYKTRPSSAELFRLEDPRLVQVKEGASSEVAESVASLSLQPTNKTPSVTAIEAKIAAVDIVVTGAKEASALSGSKINRLKDLNTADTIGAIREDPVLLPPPAAAVVDEPKNPEGKRERTPPTPPALGSPVRMESDDEGLERPKRAKTPPLAPVTEPARVPVASPTVVKAERRKSAPKSARTSGSSVTAVPTSAAPKKAPATETPTK